MTTVLTDETEAPPSDETRRPTTIALGMQGGGVGKSTLTLSLATALSRMGKRVIVIDNDPQQTLTIFFNLKIQQAPDISRITDVLDAGRAARQRGLECKVGITSAVTETEWGFGFVPGGPGLITWDKGWDLDDLEVLRKAIVIEDTDADYVLIDCPPALGFNSMNALTAATHLIMVGEPRFKAWECIPQFLDTVKKVRERTNPGLDFLGVIVNLFDTTESECHDYLAMYEETFGDKLWKPIVPDTVAAASMFSRHQTVYEMKSRSGAPRLRLVIDELAAKLIEETA